MTDEKSCNSETTWVHNVHTITRPLVSALDAVDNRNIAMPRSLEIGTLGHQNFLTVDC